MSKYTAEFVEAEVEVAMTQGKHGTAAMFREFATLLREREAAKAAVTDEIAETASEVEQTFYLEHSDTEFMDSKHFCVKAMRAALEAVAPMLAGARVPDGWMDSIRYAIEVLESEAEIRDNDDAGNRTMKRHIRALKAMLAAAPKPEKE